MTLKELYQYAEDRRIEVDFRPLRTAESLSLPLSDGVCAIAMDPGRLRSEQEEAVKLAHELGHCETGSFYTRFAPFDERGRCEARATRWAIRALLPYEALAAAMAGGLRDVPALAEHFSVTEELVAQAVAYYTETLGLRFGPQEQE